MKTHSPLPQTQESLFHDLQSLGVGKGDHLFVHSSLKKLGWVAGGPVAVIEALMQAVGSQGTVMMPTHTPDNTEPSWWENPPIPREWWETVRRHSPPFDPKKTPTMGMGKIPELFRSFPGVLRGPHPIGSFAAWGTKAEFLVTPHPLHSIFGEESPLARLYDLGGKVLFLGVDYETCTSFHLAEVRAAFPGKSFKKEGCSLLNEKGERQWATFDIQEFQTEDFPLLGKTFEWEHHGAFAQGKVGLATCRIFSMRPLVDFAVSWMEKYRR